MSSGWLNNCLVVSNSAYQDGGGAYSSVLNNCTLTSNSASTGGGAREGTLNNCALLLNSAYSGGGTAYGALRNCKLMGNAAGYSGGGAYSGTLNNCTLTRNSASEGGGVSYGTLNNCIVSYNSAPNGYNYLSPYNMNYCCTQPAPASGSGNISVDPRFVLGGENGSNLRLQSNSPCINAGLNEAVSGSSDLDGRPRIVGGTVDMGAYEFQGIGMSEFIGWLQQHGMPTDGSTDYSDADLDGMNNWQEWVADTDPTNAASLLQLLPPVVVPPTLLLRWNGDASHTYLIERATKLTSLPTFSPLQTHIPGETGTTTFTDTTWDAAAFYRVGTDSGGLAPLSLQAPLFVPASVTVTWTSVTNRSYVLERSAGLSAPTLFTPVATNVQGQTGTTSFIDTTTTGPGPFLYRVSLQQ